MKHTITEFKEWPKGFATSYHDWIVLASKTEITKKLGFKPTKYNRSGDKWTYQWNCLLNDGEYRFILYDMSYGRRIGKDQVVEYHIGFDCNYDDLHEFWPNTLESLDMLEALNERGLNVKHSDIWEKFHSEGVLTEIETQIAKNLKNARP